MKFAIVLFAVLAVAAANAIENGNGQPGCQTPEELSPNNKWRNNWDQSAFWRCNTLGVNAELVRCENETYGERTAFSPVTRECILQAEWEWIAPEAPPSKPDPNQE